MALQSECNNYIVKSSNLVIQVSMQQRLSKVVDKFPSYIPDRLKPKLKILKPAYIQTKQRLYQVLPERVEDTRWGPAIYVDPANYVERSIARGEFETQVIDFMVERVSGSDIHFADIGANIGFYSILCAMTIERGTVDAFEPIPRNRMRFHMNLELNDIEGVEIHPFGFSDQEGASPMVIDGDRPGEASLHREVTKRTETETVMLKTLDNHYSNLNESPDLVKIDVEGAEGKVLRGGEGVLRSATPDLIIELHPTILKTERNGLSQIAQTLQDCGYDGIHIIDQDETSSIDSIEDITENVHIYVSDECPISNDT